MKRLPICFFRRETTQVAEELLGKVLCFRDSSHQLLKGEILETEAYLGARDPSCHSFQNKKTKRTRVMFEAGGLCYVYFTYGMHYCFNIITAKKEEPEAVLIRSLRPIKGIETMKKNRKQGSLPQLCSGPAKLTQALGIDLSLNYQSLDSKKIYIEEGKVISKKDVTITERVGLSFKSDACYWPLRFSIV